MFDLSVSLHLLGTISNCVPFHFAPILFLQIYGQCTRFELLCYLLAKLFHPLYHQN